MHSEYIIFLIFLPRFDDASQSALPTRGPAEPVCLPPVQTPDDMAGTPDTDRNPEDTLVPGITPTEEQVSPYMLKGKKKKPSAIKV